MLGGRSELVAVQDFTHVLRRLAEIAGKLHFFVAELRHLGDGAVEIVFHKVAHGVKLETDAIDLVSFRGPGRTRGGQGSSDGCANKSSSIHGAHCTPFEEIEESLNKKAALLREPPFLGVWSVRNRNEGQAACGADRGLHSIPGSCWIRVKSYC